MRSKLTYSNVISTICLFLLLGGGAAFAASQLPKNSVGSKQIKKNAVTGAKVKNQSLTGKDIKLSTLGQVPSAAIADTANGLAAPEAIHLVGNPGEPPFLDGSKNLPAGGEFKIQAAGFYKDHEGVVHLEGAALSGTEESPIKGLLFQLPPGDRPASGTAVLYAQGEGGIFVFGSNVTVAGKNLEGDVLASKSPAPIFLSGITFRAQS